ncbi:MAG: hypothetical protein NT072_13095 [Deltaproteobacteria bacterium]|nr:hypothetical protein [Deltaproteobacteria bacterium]
MTYNKAAALYDQHAKDPELEPVYRDMLARIEANGDHSPTDWKAELKEQWEREI